MDNLELAINPDEETLHPLNAVMEYAFDRMSKEDYLKIWNKQNPIQRRTMTKMGQEAKKAISRGLTYEMSTEDCEGAEKIWNEVRA